MQNKNPCVDQNFVLGFSSMLDIWAANKSSVFIDFQLFHGTPKQNMTFQ